MNNAFNAMCQSSSLTVELNARRCTLRLPGGAQAQSTVADLKEMLTNQLGQNGRQAHPLKWVKLIAESGNSRLVCNIDRGNASFILAHFIKNRNTLDWSWNSQFWGPRGSKQWNSKKELVLFDWFFREDFPKICDQNEIEWGGDKTMSLLLQALLSRNPFWGLLKRDERKCVHDTLVSPFLDLRSLEEHNKAFALLESRLLTGTSV
ncbi:MAG: hypothetical protein WAW91_02590 [Candidatus Nanoperiomorbaceae bacterium]